MREQTIKRQLLSLPVNARFTLLLQPLWSIPFFLYNSYSSLYMIKLGITPTEIGIISSAGFVFRTIVAIFAGSIINRLGRKVSTILFDALSWLLPLLLWAFAANYWFFLLAGIINSVVVINGMSAQLYLIEDTNADQRFFCFSIMEVVNVMSGFLVPLTGFLIGKYTLVPTIRGIYIFAFVCMCIMIVSKIVFLSDTTIGQKLKEKKKNNKYIFADLLKDSSYIIGKPQLVVLMSTNILINFGATISGLYLFPYLTGHIGFKEAEVSVFPFLSSVVILAVLLLLVPRIKNKKRFMKLGLLMYVIGAVLLVTSPVIGSVTTVVLAFLILIANTFCWAFARAFLTPIIQEAIADEVDNNVRANVMGVFSMLSTLCIFPAGFIGGMLYQYRPIYPFFFALLIYIVSLMLFMCKGKAHQ